MRQIPTIKNEVTTWEFPHGLSNDLVQFCEGQGVVLFRILNKGKFPIVVITEVVSELVVLPSEQNPKGFIPPGRVDQAETKQISGLDMLQDIFQNLEIRNEDDMD